MLHGITHTIQAVNSCSISCGWAMSVSSVVIRKSTVFEWFIKCQRLRAFRVNHIVKFRGHYYARGEFPSNFWRWMLQPKSDESDRPIWKSNIEWAQQLSSISGYPKSFLSSQIMSRIPQLSQRPTSKVRAPAPAHSRIGSPSKLSASSPARLRTKSNPQTPSKSHRRPASEDEPPVPKTPISIKEAIALKRAEVKRAEAKASSSRGFDDFEGMDAAPTKRVEEDIVDELGRWSVIETIERARSTGDYKSFFYSSMEPAKQSRFKARLILHRAIYRVSHPLCLRSILA